MARSLSENGRAAGARAIPPVRSPSLPPAFQAALLGVIAGNLGVLVLLVAQRSWLVDADGLPEAVDFITFWAGSRMALQGLAAEIYDPVLLKAAEVAALGHDFSGSLGWFYPPHFMLVAWPLSLMPVVAAQLVWTGLTLLCFAFVLVRIAGWNGLSIGLAFPACLSTVMVGQNGFLTAALLGAALLALPSRPVLAGLLFGALSIKPHFGLLVPLALIAGGYWRIIVWATISTLALVVVSALAFGIEAWTAFAGSLAGTNEALLARGLTGYDKLQSLFGLLRHLGLGLVPAMVAQGLVSGGAVLGVMLAWRSELRTDIKAAALALGVVMATPYLYLYDLVLLAVPLAFLARSEWDRIDLALVGAAMLAAFAYPFCGASSGFGATIMVAALVLRRSAPAWASPHRAAVKVS